ncbi:MAG: molecular chaperone DnaK, partial [Clostridia bacterium]|nr:molecular chaperone DnaK [Clostridia bacterium]
LIFNSEKIMKDNGDKLSEEDKTALANAIEEAKKHLASEDLTELKSASDAFTKVTNDVFSKMYQKASEEAPKDDKKDGQNGDDEVVVE